MLYFLQIRHQSFMFMTMSIHDKVYLTFNSLYLQIILGEMGWDHKAIKPYKNIEQLTI
jgi:hypothetical protein